MYVCLHVCVSICYCVKLWATQNILSFSDGYQSEGKARSFVTKIVNIAHG